MMDRPVVPPRRINDALLLGTMIFKFSSQLLFFEMDKEPSDKAHEHDTQGTYLRTLIGV